MVIKAVQNPFRVFRNKSNLYFAVNQHLELINNWSQVEMALN